MNNVKFYLGKKTKDTAKTKIPVVLAFNYNAKRLYTQAGIRVLESEWDKSNKCVKSKVAGSLEMNKHLAKTIRCSSKKYFPHN
jgi:hypothetical protein